MDDKMNADKLAQAFRAGFLCACKWPSPVAQDVDSPGFQKDFEAWLAAQPALPAQPVGVQDALLSAMKKAADAVFLVADANVASDISCLLAKGSVAIENLCARVQELERENGNLRTASRKILACNAEMRATIELDDKCSAQREETLQAWLERARHAEAELAAIKNRIAGSATATLRITYEEDRAMGVYLRDMDIGTLCWLDGECVHLLPLDDEAKEKGE